LAQPPPVAAVKPNVVLAPPKWKSSSGRLACSTSWGVSVPSLRKTLSCRSMPWKPYWTSTFFTCPLSSSGRGTGRVLRSTAAITCVPCCVLRVTAISLSERSSVAAL